MGLGLALTFLRHGQPNTISFKTKDDVMIAAANSKNYRTWQALRLVSFSDCETSVSGSSRTTLSGCIRAKRDSVCILAHQYNMRRDPQILAIKHDSGTNLAHCALSIIFVRPAGPAPHHASGTCWSWEKITPQSGFSSHGYHLVNRHPRERWNPIKC